jgi:dihydroneopterin aldolase
VTGRASGSPGPLSPRELLLFEAGIKLGGVFHQYLGIPLNDRTAPGLARTIERAVRLQPFVRKVEVRIAPARGGRLGQGRYAYRYLTAEMLDVRVKLADGRTAVRARLAHRPELRYPLMWVEGPGGGAGPSTSAGRPARRQGRSGRRRPRSAGSAGGRRTPPGRGRSSRRRGSPRTPA